ncbi:hypothetical protein AYK24_03675 [Thermoplasmatales archaeon SG8-52-4]|nr:MAG: hypothetical protein AYK24_03675 [Thermoplasmatales archaeon SG8-52-4]
MLEYKEHLELLEKKLKGRRFEIKHNIPIPPYQIDLLAIKTSFEVSKFSKMTRAIAFTFLENVDIGLVKSYSIASTKYALENRGSILPRGLGGSLLSIPVIVSNGFNIDTILWMEKTIAEKHWAAFEFPVLISLKDRKIFYCKKTPIWGGAYYSGFRKFIEENLG